jgi:hypothetical protein
VAESSDVSRVNINDQRLISVDGYGAFRPVAGTREQQSETDRAQNASHNYSEIITGMRSEKTSFPESSRSLLLMCHEDHHKIVIFSDIELVTNNVVELFTDFCHFLFELREITARVSILPRCTELSLIG